MAHQVYSVVSGGLIVPVMIGVSGDLTAALLASGRSIVTPFVVNGLIDTGSNSTAVSPDIVARLAISPCQVSTTEGIGGDHPVNLFELSLSILDAKSSVTLLTHANLLVMQLPRPLTEVDVLIGRDVLLGTKFFLDGPARTFTLET